MFSIINIAEVYTLIGAQILFFFNFLSVFFLSYATGYLIIYKKIKRNTFQYSLVSLIFFSTIIAITVNFYVSYAKHIITIFYFLNIFVFLINETIRKKFLEALKKNIKFFFLIFILYIFFNNFIYSVAEINNNKLNFIYRDDDSYFYNPIREILFSDYLSRIRISTLYPMEWGSYYFFQAAFNAIFLKPIASSGLIGFLYLKNFFLSSFYSLLISYVLDKNLLKKTNSLITSFFAFIILCVIFYFHKTNWNILTNGFVSVLLALFIADSLVKNRNKETYFFSILLAISSFKFVFVGFFIYFFNFFQETKFSLRSVIDKFKKVIEYVDVVFILIFLVYFVSTFINSTQVYPTFNLPNKAVTGWWHMTISQNIIINLHILLYNFLFFITFYFFLIQKKYIKIYMESFNLKILYYLLIILFVPFFCFSLIYSKDLILSLNAPEKLDIFISSISWDNLIFFCYLPIIWFLLLVNFNNSIKYLFLALITWHSFLAIFIDHGTIVPIFYLIEMIILFYSYLYILENKNKFKKNIFVFFFIFIIFSNYLLIKNYFKPTQEHTWSSHSFEYELDLLTLKKLSQKEFLCAKDISKFNILNNRILSNAVSSLLAKNFYKEILYLNNFNKYNYWSDGSARWAVVPEEIKTSLCVN